MESLYPGISGFIAGTVSTTLLLPLDVIKVRLQVHEGTTTTTTSVKESSSSSSNSSNTTNRRRSISSLRVARGILKYEGLQGLYVGWSPAVVGSAVSWGGYFYVYEAFKKSCRQWKRDRARQQQQQQHESTNVDNITLNSLDHFVLSCAAGGVMVLVTNPIWLVKTRMQLQMKKASEQHNVKPYHGMRDAFRTILRKEGPFALYRGSGAAFLLTSNGGIQFAVYEYLRRVFHVQRANLRQKNSNSNNNAPSLWERFEMSLGYMAIGAVAKIIASTATYPLQVAKSRLQQRAEALEFTEDGHVRVVQRQYHGLMETFRRIGRSEGFVGFFKGCIPNALRVAPSAAVTFVVYEMTMDFLQSSSSSSS
mmetsp:Transcript_2763/g.7729  ORF Transcript_2763/g.7729 Transcript_2763/m.7729 type:complete len:365 (+) Transcript_2763:40-1134(+)